MALTDIQKNVSEVRERMARAALAAGRDPGEISLLAAVKYADEGTLAEIVSSGVDGVGENRVQQLTARDTAGAYGTLPVHFIGSLQTNKVRYVVERVSLIHSLDSLRLAAEIEKQAAAREKRMDVLAEINCAAETAKGGVLPQDAADFCLSLSRFPHLRLAGFMTMAPKCDDSRDYIKYFSETYKLSIDIWRGKLHNNNEPVLSWGMSDSFEEAIATGATIVRVGRKLFAPRDGDA